MQAAHAGEAATHTARLSYLRPAQALPGRICLAASCTLRPRQGDNGSWITPDHRPSPLACWNTGSADALAPGRQTVRSFPGRHPPDGANLPRVPPRKDVSKVLADGTRRGDQTVIKAAAVTVTLESEVGRSPALGAPHFPGMRRAVRGI